MQCLKKGFDLKVRILAGGALPLGILSNLHNDLHTLPGTFDRMASLCLCMKSSYTYICFGTLLVSVICMYVSLGDPEKWLSPNEIRRQFWLLELASQQVPDFRVWSIFSPSAALCLGFFMFRLGQVSMDCGVSLRKSSKPSTHDILFKTS